MTRHNRDRLFSLLEKAQTDDRASKNIDRFLGLLIIANIIAVTLETVDSLHSEYHVLFNWFEGISVVIFTIEYLLRIWVAASDDIPERSDLAKRLAYIFSPSGLIDVIAILPALLPFIFPGLDLRWLRVLRLLRIFKISHYSSAIEDFISAIYYERDAFAGAFYLFCITLFGTSSMMYIAENQIQPEHFSSIPESLWWSLITLTTVGYGDVAPVTTVGKLIGGLTAMMGVCVVALMTGIVASAFSAQQRRKTGLLEAEISEALKDGVITPEEMTKINSLKHQLHMRDEHVKAIIDLMSQRGQDKS